MSIEINSIKQNQINTANNSKIIAFKSKPIPNDKVELSTKKELSNGQKIGIGIGIASFVGLGVELIWGKGKHLKSLWEKISGKGVNNVDEGKKYLDKIDDIKENFSKIFGRDYTKDEAQELALKYKEIFETEDNNECLDNFLKQIRKDYDLPEFGFYVNKMKSSIDYAEWGLYSGGITYNRDLISIVDGKITNVDRLHLIKAIAHELKHATQDKVANQVDIHKNIIAKVDREERHNSEAWQKALRLYGSDIDETRRKLSELLYRKMIPSFKTLEKIHEDSPLYQKGLEYIEGTRNYILPSEEGLDRYKNQLVEKEAFDAGDRMEQIYKWLMNK